MLETNALPWTMRVHQQQIQELGDVLKQLDAPFGEFGMKTLTADTKALESQSPEEKLHTGVDAQLQTCDTARQGLAKEILSVLQAAETGRAPLDEHLARSLTARADALIQDASTLAADSSPPAQQVCG